MEGHLKANNVNVTWCRVRSSLWRVDPVGILSRTIQATLIIRRKYCVPGSLALWHVDVNHKLIRWGFVIHGAIDGFSHKNHAPQMQHQQHGLYCIRSLNKCN